MASKDYDELLQQIEDIQDENSIKDYHAFVYWFIETLFGYDKAKILNSICDGCHDKGVDAVLIDHIERHVCIIQSKFERAGSQVQLSEADIKQFAAVKNYFQHRKALDSAIVKANQLSSRLLNEAFEAIRRKGYSLELVFITTHRKAPQIDGLIRETLKFKPGEFSLYDYTRIIQLFQDRRRDFTPPLGPYHLPYKDSDKYIIRTPQSKAWVLTVAADEIRALVTKHGDKLFRKNVRNFLGSNRCNKAIQLTLANNPENFWYYNNGISILCDEANLDVENKYIRMVNPQIVNGCQTVKSIQLFKGELNADVLVRVIESRSHEFINAITLYQNSSNPVRNRDFKSNDPVQVRLKQEFRRRGYYYEIKRGEEFKKTIKQFPAAKKEYQNGELNNEKVAKVLAAVRINPETAVSKGSEAFFDELYDDIFPHNISTSDCLTPFLLHRAFIRETYIGAEKRFHKFDKPYVFKNPASFHVLSIMYKALRRGLPAGWEKSFIAFCEGSTDREYNVFWKKLAKIISDYFEICYDAWKKSGVVDYNTYLQSRKSSSDIASKYKTELASMEKTLLNLFQDRILVRASYKASR